MQPHHPHMGGGVNSAFAALLEATVFKDRLAAGIILLPYPFASLHSCISLFAPFSTFI